MHDEHYIKLGETKMINIDFSLSYPSTAYYLSVNMLIEFDQVGQVIPTRIDCLPYKLGAFSSYNMSNNKLIDFLKFVLVLYTAKCVFDVFKTRGFSTTIAKEQFTDIMITLL